MTDLLEKAVAAVRQMSADDQDTIAQAMLSMAKIADSLEIEPEHVAAVMASLEQADRGAFVEGEASTIIARALPALRLLSHRYPRSSRVRHRTGIAGAVANGMNDDGCVRDFVEDQVRIRDRGQAANGRIVGLLSEHRVICKPLQCVLDPSPDMPGTFRRSSLDIFRSARQGRSKQDG